MQRIHARSSVSISDLKKNPSGVIAEAQGAPVAILNHNRPTAYLVPAAAFEALLEKLDDLGLARQVRERQGEETVRVTLDDL
ncbi:MAG: antitoxin [Desulfuromonadales bacterium GWD2_61_12]|nr:MAG: antitoxin [Desulfuromonadales bacterium GWC2_61_20]OGR34038.1 MAG: antitoxin [Desulfuromonadales bacterium GWD2_61_12]HAD03835.1 antitoxin [Desulfuromonas sp.]HBT83682.1 antitoxin [Desulfuromonas sp.]